MKEQLERLYNISDKGLFDEYNNGNADQGPKDYLLIQRQRLDIDEVTDDIQ